jgi:hypothetical protein
LLFQTLPAQQEVLQPPCCPILSFSQNPVKASAVEPGHRQPSGHDPIGCVLLRAPHRTGDYLCVSHQTTLLSSLLSVLQPRCDDGHFLSALSCHSSRSICCPSFCRYQKSRLWIPSAEWPLPTCYISWVTRATTNGSVTNQQPLMMFTFFQSFTTATLLWKGTSVFIPE